MTPISRFTLRLQSDSRLVELAASGHSLAFEAIAERYRSPLLRYCTRLLADDTAEDVVQETFMKAHAALGGDERPRDLRPWLYRIAHNLAVNALLKNRYDYEQLSNDYDGVPQPPDIVDGRWRFTALMRRIADLPERQRSALVFREFEGRSYEEIASELDATPRIVGQLLNRARNRLRDSVGLLIPMPVIRALLANASQGGPGPAEVATGAAGAGGLAKLGAGMLAAATIAAGTGVAVQDRSDRGHRRGNGAGPAQSQSRYAAAVPSERLAALIPAGDSSGNNGSGGRANSGHGSPNDGDRSDADGERDDPQGAEGPDDDGDKTSSDPEEDSAQAEGTEGSEADALGDDLDRVPPASHVSDGAGGVDSYEALESDPPSSATPE
jgi:RNA polymerase sigma factor (sigma-70 family)